MTTCTWSWSTARVVNSSSTSLRIGDWRSRRPARCTPRFCLVSNTFTNLASFIVIWSLRIYFLTITTTSNSLTLACPISTRRAKSWRPPVVVLATPHPKWSEESVTLALVQIYGAQVSFSTQWFAVTCLLKIKTLRNSTRRSSRLNIKCPLSYLSRPKTWSVISWIRTRPSAIRYRTFVTIRGTLSASISRRTRRPFTSVRSPSQ